MVDTFDSFDYWIIVSSFFCLSYRVGSVLIILNISDLEVVSTTKHSSSFGGIERLVKKRQIQLVRLLAPNRFCILRERNSTPIYLRNFTLLASLLRYGRP